MGIYVWLWFCKKVFDRAMIYVVGDRTMIYVVGDRTMIYVVGDNTGTVRRWTGGLNAYPWRVVALSPRGSVMFIPEGVVVGLYTHGSLKGMHG